MILLYETLFCACLPQWLLCCCGLLFRQIHYRELVGPLQKIGDRDASRDPTSQSIELWEVFINTELIVRLD